MIINKVQKGLKKLHKSLKSKRLCNDLKDNLKKNINKLIKK